MTFGFSRDDAGKFLPEYVDAKILPADPFVTIDVAGVGALVRLGGRRGPRRAARAQDRHLRRARRRSRERRVLPRGRARLRVVLAVPRADRAAGRGAGGGARARGGAATSAECGPASFTAGRRARCRVPARGPYRLRRATGRVAAFAPPFRGPAMFIEEYLQDLRRDRFTPAALRRYARRWRRMCAPSSTPRPRTVRSIWSVALAFFAAAFLFAVALALAWRPRPRRGLLARDRARGFRPPSRS